MAYNNKHVFSPSFWARVWDRCSGPPRVEISPEAAVRPLARLIREGPRPSLLVPGLAFCPVGVSTGLPHVVVSNSRTKMTAHGCCHILLARSKLQSLEQHCSVPTVGLRQWLPPLARVPSAKWRHLALACFVYYLPIPLNLTGSDHTGGQRPCLLIKVPSRLRCL